MADQYERDPTIRVHPSDIDSETAELAAIRAEIQQTRARMSHTVEDIGHRLNPDRLKEQLKHNVHEATIGKAEHMARNAIDRVDDTRHNVLDTIRDNPVPAALVGIGLGWMLFNGRRSDHAEYHAYEYDQAYRPVQPGYYRPGWEADQGQWGRTSSSASGAAGSMMDRGEDLAHSVRDRGEEMVSHARERGEDMAHRAQDRVTELAHDVRDTVSDVADRAQDVVGDTASRARSMARGAIREGRHTTHRIEDRIQNMLHDSPLAVGATVVALGLAAGLAAPATRREAELMGPTRDRLLHQAREKVTDAAERAQNVAGRVAREVEGTARRAVHEFEDTAREAVDDVQETARNAARDEGLL
jgi:gas vesicle protein